MTQQTPEFLYHWSTTKLDILTPKISTHWKEWVYAAISKEIALAFIPKADDFDFSREYNDGKFYIIERYPEAFKKYYHTSWYLYTLPSDWFESWRTSRSPERVCTSSVIPQNIEFISDVWEYLQSIQSDDSKILLFNKQPKRLKDKYDLIEKAVQFSHDLWKEYILSVILEKHPDIYEKVKEILG